jgi:hypothetical protein
VLGCLAGLAPTVRVLLGGTPESLGFDWDALHGAFTVEVDALSAFFLVPVLGLSALAAVYGGDYLLAYRHKKSLGSPWLFFNLFVAGMAMFNGLGFDRALRAITKDAAKLLGIDDQFGSIEPGKVADLVLYDGDPFERATHVTHTIVSGRVVYDRYEYLKLPFARRALPLTGAGGVGCCMEAW